MPMRHRDVPVRLCTCNQPYVILPWRHFNEEHVSRMAIYATALTGIYLQASMHHWRPVWRMSAAELTKGRLYEAEHHYASTHAFCHHRHPRIGASPAIRK